MILSLNSILLGPLLSKTGHSTMHFMKIVFLQLRWPCMKRNHILLLAASLIAASVPITAWVFFKPIRIIAPQLNGVTCVDVICIDSVATLPAALQLHSDAMSNVALKLRPLKSPPLTVFCSTRSCYESFGGNGRGITVFHLGVVIPPDSWQSYIVEHEFIHMLQAQELGLRGPPTVDAWDAATALISEPKFIA